ncbi:MAG: DUF433 domain-containing protein [Thermomicrobiales bacterium]
MGVLMVFTVPQVERLTGLSRRTVKRWQESGVFIPDNPEPLAIDGPYRRIYTFRDVVGLRTLTLLRRKYGVGVEQLAKVGDYLKRHVDAPWSSMRFWVSERRVVFEDPELGRRRIAGVDPKQIALEIALAPIAGAVERDAETLKRRDPAKVGTVDRHRNVMSNAWVVAGTRIPTSAIRSFSEAGYGVEAIIREYPDLLPADVEQALAHEAARRQRAA